MENDRSGPRYIDVKTCAQFLSLHPQSVYRMIDRRQIPAVRVGGSVRVDRVRLEAMLDDQQGKAR